MKSQDYWDERIFQCQGLVQESLDKQNTLTLIAAVGFTLIELFLFLYGWRYEDD